MLSCLSSSLEKSTIEEEVATSALMSEARSPCLSIGLVDLPGLTNRPNVVQLEQILGRGSRPFGFLQSTCVTQEFCEIMSLIEQTGEGALNVD